MKPLQRRYRAWLDQRMPTPQQQAVDRDAVLAAVARRSGRWTLPTLVVGVAALTAAVVAAVVMLRPARSPRPQSPPQWDVLVSLHEVGTPSENDVRIQIGIREESTR